MPTLGVKYPTVRLCFVNSTEVSSNQLQGLLCKGVFQSRVQIQELLLQLIWNK